MKIPVIKIGNSKGIRFSKILIEKYNIREMVDLKLEENQIVIKAIPEPRKGWEI